jgi:hypothetical protein
MTEQEWLDCMHDPKAMNAYLYHQQTGIGGGMISRFPEQPGKAALVRKWGLVSSAFCREFSHCTRWLKSERVVDRELGIADAGDVTDVTNTALWIIDVEQYASMTGMYNNQQDYVELEERWRAMHMLVKFASGRLWQSVPLDTYHRSALVLLERWNRSQAGSGHLR